MKLAFMSSTCPNFTVDEVIVLAKKLGCEGFEPRVGWGHSNGIEVSSPPERVQALGRQLADAGIAIPCIASSVRTAVLPGQARQEQLDEVKRMVDLAILAGAPNIRVFGQGEKEWDEATRMAHAIDTLSEAALIAAGSGVTLCLETHDNFRAGRMVGHVVDAVNRPEVQVLWDITHAVMVGEKVPDTAKYIKLDRVKHCHVRDLFLTRAENGVLTAEQCLDFGKGDAAAYVGEAAKMLSQSGYTGYFSLEVIFKPSDTSHDATKFLTTAVQGMRSVIL